MYSIANLAERLRDDGPAVRGAAPAWRASGSPASWARASRSSARSCRARAAATRRRSSPQSASAARSWPSLVGDSFDWRTAYFIGGVMGIALLVLRIGVHESGMFEQAKTLSHARGNFLQLFATRERARALRRLHPDRRAHLVRGRHPGHVLAGVRQGDGHDAAAERRPRRDVLLHGAGARRPRRAAGCQPVGPQPEARRCGCSSA